MFRGFIFRYNVFGWKHRPVTWRFFVRSYGPERPLRHSLGKRFRVTYAESFTRGAVESRFLLFHDGRYVAKIIGYFTDEHFYVYRVSVPVRRRGFGRRYLPLLFSEVVCDARRRGCALIRTTALRWLVPKVKRLFPFVEKEDFLSVLPLLNRPLVYEIRVRGSRAAPSRS